MIGLLRPWGEGWDEGKRRCRESLLTRAVARSLLYMDVRMPCSTGCTGAAPQGEMKEGDQCCTWRYGADRQGG